MVDLLLVALNLGSATTVKVKLNAWQAVHVALKCVIFKIK
jgi:hypothetical protein